MSSQRYRITITPISSDGLPRSGCCTIEFERRSRQNWMRQLEAVQRQRQLSGDDCAALVVGLQLLKELASGSGTQTGSPPALPVEVLQWLDRLEQPNAAP